jgi:capsular exopolysaccharide synthesis family protein
MKMDATRRNLEWMTQKADAERLKQQAEEGRLQEYIKNNNLVTLENRVAILPEKMSQLGRDLVTAETKTKEYKLLYDKVQNVSDNLDAAETVLSISEGGSLDVLRSLILKAEQNIMELSSKYGEKHPVMIKARGDLSVLKKKRQQEIHRIIEKVKEQYDQARSNESSIRAQLEKTKAEALDLNEKYVEYSSLKGEIETNRQLYDALLTKLKDQSLTGETRPVNIWVVENANTPIKPAKPIIALNLSLGLFLGIVFGLGSVFLFDQYDNKIKSVEGVQDALKVPVLGSVTFNKKANDINESIVNDPRSEYAENFNSLRTTLLLSSADTPPKKILVTSSVAGEGKTTVSVNLALSMAMAGSSVALIDADMRKSSIYKIFNLENDLGLSNYLTESSKTKSKRKSIGPLSIYLQKSTHKNLSIIPSGPVPPNPYGLLNSNRMEGLIAELEEEFDFIICDSPPVLSVADSRLLSRMFDGLILITRSGLTSFSMAKETINLLQNVNAHIFGILINGVQEIDQADYYGAYRSYFDETNKVQKVAAGPHLKKDTTNDDPTEREL